MKIAAQDPEIKGWCPGALRPMASGDGLVVRVRPPMGHLSPAQAQGVAQACKTHGNGWLELSNRANLQLRGVTEDSHKGLLDDLARLGLLDADLRLESRRNLILQPFHNPDDGTMALARALTQALPDLPDLPAKFGTAIDCGPAPLLQATSADLRFERAANGTLILRADGAALGQAVTPDSAVRDWLALAHWFVDQGGITEGRGRMRALTGRGVLPAGATLAPAPAALVPAPGVHSLGSLAAFAFGSFRAETLSDLAALGHPLRLTPWRMLLIEGAKPADLAAIPGLILMADDPLLSVVACPGAPFCPQAHQPTRDLARVLAPKVPQGALLHVSGCAKACAHPAPATLTLTATPDGFASGPGAAVLSAATILTAALPTFDHFAPERAL